MTRAPAFRSADLRDVMQGGMLPLNPRNGDALVDRTDADETNAAFDVPAFLRRQDG